eukprot:gene4915-6126_t
MDNSGSFSSSRNSYIGNDGRVTQRSQWRVSAIPEYFWSFLNQIMMFFHTLISDPATSNYKSGKSNNQPERRRMGGLNDYGVGSGGGSNRPRGAGTNGGSKTFRSMSDIGACGASSGGITLPEDLNGILSAISKSTTLEEFDIIIGYPELRIPSGSLPKCLKELSIYVYYSVTIQNYENLLEVGSIPEEVWKLKVPHKFIRRDPQKLVPQSVKHLSIIGWCCTNELDQFPPSVETLHFINSCEGVKEGPWVNGFFPPNLTELQFMDVPLMKDDLTPGELPNTLRVLNLGPYDLPLTPEVIPSLNLKSFEINSYCKDNPIVCIPHGVERVKFGSKLRKFLFKEGIFPDSVTNLELFSTTQPIFQDHILPSNLKRLYIKSNSDLIFQHGVSMLPQTLVYLDWWLSTISIGILPPTLKTLRLCNPKIQSIEPNSIPNSVTEIEFVYQVKFEIIKDILPSSLLHLKLLEGTSPSTPFPVLPTHLMSLEILGLNPVTIPENSIPESLEILHLGFTPQLPKGVLPPNLKSLILNRINENDPFDNIVLPNSQSHHSFNQSAPTHIPNFLQSH